MVHYLLFTSKPRLGHHFARLLSLRRHSASNEVYGHQSASLFILTCCFVLSVPSVCHSPLDLWCQHHCLPKQRWRALFHLGPCHHLHFPYGCSSGLQVLPALPQMEHGWELLLRRGALSGIRRFQFTIRSLSRRRFTFRTNYYL